LQQKSVFKEVAISSWVAIFLKHSLIWQGKFEFGSPTRVTNYRINHQRRYMKFSKLNALLISGGVIVASLAFTKASWESKFLKVNSDNTITYVPDEKGNVIPDFSRVGYHEGDRPIPNVRVVEKIKPSSKGSSQEIIQKAIDKVSLRVPDENGFRGAILFKKGRYQIPGSIKINASGVVLRGEKGAVLVATGKTKRNLLLISGSGSITEIQGTRTKITNDFVPLGAKSFDVLSAGNFKVGDKIVVFRPGTRAWISDLKMDKIKEKENTRQWQPEEYSFHFERKVTSVEGSRISIDNPVVMAMEKKYGGGEIYKYSFDGRIAEVGIENLEFESEFANHYDEDHGWIAIEMDKAENCWVRNVVSRYFGYSCVSLEVNSRNITVIDSKCYEPKSIITGGRRYSFNNMGQMNLFMNLVATEGRHDYVTGQQVRGPNVFFNCKSIRAHSDNGPHHRWSMGTLFDNVETDLQINVQDRSNSGSGHGWSGVNQVFWNCKAKEAVVQSPWVSGKNYAIGMIATKRPGMWFNDRPDGEWEGHNQPGLSPASLYLAQLKARQLKK
jgi:hypothetical protein